MWIKRPLSLTKDTDDGFSLMLSWGNFILLIMSWLVDWLPLIVMTTSHTVQATIETRGVGASSMKAPNHISTLTLIIKCD